MLRDIVSYRYPVVGRLRGEYFDSYLMAWLC
jgi:hypothetical protein